MKTYHAIGLMSGTSLDGLDIAYVRFCYDQAWSFSILEAETISYEEEWKKTLQNSTLLSAERLLQLHSDYGFLLGKLSSAFITKHKISQIDCIASHGHTVFHQPQKKFTTQIGDGRAIKLITQTPVIYDFRTQDVLMGGNGAPLVPIGDKLLFASYDACLNLGGFSNISMEREGKRIAFDICPVNIILNRLSNYLGQAYDNDGLIAKNATANEDVLSELNQLEFYHQAPPKSLGIEWCEAHVFPLLKELSYREAIATCTQHAAEQIAGVIRDYHLKNVLFTGGGVYNSYLIDCIKEITDAEIVIPEKSIIEFKEALIFAFMGILRLNNEINVLSSATGSSHDHSSGTIA